MGLGTWRVLPKVGTLGGIMSEEPQSSGDPKFDKKEESTDVYVIYWLWTGAAPEYIVDAVTLDRILDALNRVHGWSYRRR